MAVKLQRPSERVKARYRPETPRYVKLLIVGAACLAAGVSRQFFLAPAVILLALGALDWTRDRREREAARDAENESV